MTSSRIWRENDKEGYTDGSMQREREREREREGGGGEREREREKERLEMEGKTESGGSRLTTCKWRQIENKHKTTATLDHEASKQNE